MSQRLERAKVPVVLGLLAAGGIGFATFRQPWASYTIDTQGLPPAEVTATGVEAYPLAAALALVVLTAGLAVLAAGRRLRRIVGALVVLFAIMALTLRVAQPGDVADALRSAVEASPAYTGGAVDVSVGWSWAQTLGWASFVLAGALGAVTVVGAGRWDAMARRYEAPGAERDETDLWSAISEGDDPTL